MLMDSKQTDRWTDRQSPAGTLRLDIALMLMQHCLNVVCPPEQMLTPISHVLSKAGVTKKKKKDPKLEICFQTKQMPPPSLQPHPNFQQS